MAGRRAPGGNAQGRAQPKLGQTLPLGALFPFFAARFARVGLMLRLFTQFSDAGLELRGRGGLLGGL